MSASPASCCSSVSTSPALAFEGTTTIPEGCRPFTEAGPLTQVEAYYEEERRAVWMLMKASPRPSFNPELLADVEAVFREIRETQLPIDFFISGSLIPGFYNAGGDLALFSQAIRNKDLHGLQSYALRCVDILVNLNEGFDKNILTIAMVEGSALGGGFEAALGHHFLLAQEDAKMGFPEIAFNLYPGMGAYSFVSRKAGVVVAEDLIMTGTPYPATWHAEKGLVSKTFQPGQGQRAVKTFMDTTKPKINGVRGMLKARHHANPVSRQELTRITLDWASCALDIEEKDVAYMERLVKLQNRKAR